MTRLKILNFIDYFYPTLGGLEESVYRLSSAEEGLGNHVKIITTNLTNGSERLPPGWFNFNRLKVLRLNSLKFFHTGMEMPLDLSMLRKLLLWCDIFHIHTLHTLYPPFIAWIKRFNRAKKIFAISILAYMFTKTHPSTIVRALGPIYERGMLQFAKHFDVIFVKSGKDKSRLLEEGINPILVPEGVPEYYFKRHDPRLFTEKYGITSKGIILFIGRLHKSKGPHVLQKAFHILTKRGYRDAELVYIGPDDGMKEYLVTASTKYGLNQRVKVLGYVSEAEKLSALEASSFLVLPSIYHYETCPLVIKEGWSKKKPVIASMVGALPDMIKHKVNGLLVLPNNPTSLADAMEVLLSDRHLGKKLGNEGRRNVATWTEIAKMTFGGYLRVMQI